MSPTPRWFVAICWVMAILFSVSVGLQENDPDPIRWMLIYGVAALASAALPSQHPWVPVAAGVIGLIGLIWGLILTSQVYRVLHFSDLWMKMSEKGGAVEVGREAGGLIIIAGFLLAGAVFRATRR